ncbi:MAG: DnaJ domain-containing protein [Bacteroidia bacterium]
MSLKNHYITLGVSKNASVESIKKAYRELAKKYHPDKNNTDPETEETFKEIQHAYYILSNKELRHKYNLTIVHLHGYGNTHQTHKTQQTQHRYTGNAYQYAQQQAASKTEGKKQQGPTVPFKEKKTDGDPFFLVVSIVIAVLLLLFIVLY